MRGHLGSVTSALGIAQAEDLSCMPLLFQDLVFVIVFSLGFLEVSSFHSPLPLVGFSTCLAGGVAGQLYTFPGLQWRHTWFSLLVINQSIKPWSSLHHFAT